MSRVSALTLLRGCRYQSSSTRPAVSPEIAAWIDGMTSRPIEATQELLDKQRATHLFHTLPTRLKGSSAYLNLPRTELLPKAHHLIYFQPDSLLTELGEDGSSTEYNAPSPYLRRMWAGGSFEWSSNTQNDPRIGEVVEQETSVASAELKSGMIFVNQRRDLTSMSVPRENGGNWGVREIRTHVFRRDVSGNDKIKANAKRKSKFHQLDFKTNCSESVTSSLATPTPTHTIIYTPSAPLLFRYSALTYNAHRIHYDRDWCKEVEGHPNLVVHGPLTATLLVELAEKVGLDMGKRLRRFEYRATSPMYVDREIRMDAVVDEKESRKVVMTANQEGRIGMKATAIYDDEVS